MVNRDPPCSYQVPPRDESSWNDRILWFWRFELEPLIDLGARFWVFLAIRSSLFLTIEDTRGMNKQITTISILSFIVFHALGRRSSKSTRSTRSESGNPTHRDLGRRHRWPNREVGEAFEGFGSCLSKFILFGAMEGHGILLL